MLQLMHFITLEYIYLKAKQTYKIFSNKPWHMKYLNILILHWTRDTVLSQSNCVKAPWQYTDESDTQYSRICLIRHLKGLQKSDDLGEVTNYANRWKLHHRRSYTSS